MTPAGIEPATFRFVAQRLKDYAAAVPQSTQVHRVILTILLTHTFNVTWKIRILLYKMCLA